MVCRTSKERFPLTRFPTAPPRLTTVEEVYFARHTYDTGFLVVSLQVLYLQWRKK